MGIYKKGKGYFLKHHKAHSTYLWELKIPTVIQQIFIENPLSVPGSLLGAGGVTVNMTHSLTSFLSMLNAFMGNGTLSKGIYTNNYFQVMKIISHL